jgi:hypothetical protein
LRHISGLIPEHQLQQITAIGGDRGVSAGLRETISAGLLALAGDAALLAPVEELQALVTRLSFITGRRTGSGALWCPDGCQSLPPAEGLSPDGEVVATPDAVALLADSAALVVDLGEGLILARENGAEISSHVCLGSLMPLAANIAPVIVKLGAAGPGRLQLDSTVTLERTGTGAVRLSAEGVGVTAPVETVLSFAAELLSLATRSAARSVATREALERQLQEVQP